MKDRTQALEALKEAIDSLDGLWLPRRVEPTLDALAAALKPLLSVPEELARKALSLDELLAWLAREGRIEKGTAMAASRLIEAASVEGYEWERPDTVDEDDRDGLLDGLRTLYTDLVNEPTNDDEG